MAEYAKEKELIFDGGTGSVKISSARDLIEVGFIISLWMSSFGKKMMAFGFSVERKIIQKICHNDGGRARVREREDRRP